eukprot:3512587-Pleurochrysis_carterae.AAC.1
MNALAVESLEASFVVGNAVTAAGTPAPAAGGVCFSEAVSLARVTKSSRSSSGVGMRSSLPRAPPPAKMASAAAHASSTSTGTC